VMSLATWNKLTPEQKTAFEEAAAISDAYFETVERDLTGRMEKTLRSSGVAIWRMSNEDYAAWLRLAQQTAWREYAKINPRAKELLFNTVRTYLVRLGDKDKVIDGIFGDDPKN